MKKTNPLDYRLLRRKLNSKKLNFGTTSELESLTEFVGQERALEAVNFGIGIKRKGYNLFAMGPSGIGKRSMIRTVLENKAIKNKVPFDWCYIHNFDAPEKPVALPLPPGLGAILQQDMKVLIDELSASILTVFESDEYRTRMEEIVDEFNTKREEVCKNIADDSRDDKIPHLYKDRHEKEKALQLRFTLAVAEPMIEKLKIKYKEFIDVVSYLSSVQDDILDHVNDFVKRDEITNVLFFSSESPVLIKYQVNLLVDNGKRKGAPVIFEENPSYSNLICRVEHNPQFGTLITNFTLIKPGALHKANGGYLVIEARKLKKEPHAWEGLKRALYSRKIVIEPVEHLTESIRAISLEPMAIPLDVKIILLGDRYNFYNLSNHDPDFGELFKVAVDFDEQIDRNKHNITLYARLIGTIVHKEGLRPFSAKAVAAIIDYSSRLAEDVEKLSTHIRSIDDLILEADYWAELRGKKVVQAVDVKRAYSAQIHRVDRSRESYYEEINRNFVLIHTNKKIVGQVNALSVVKVGRFCYGHPTRVTAKVRMGKGKLIDIQREIKLAGPIHTKGTLTLSHFLSGRYNLGHTFSLSASLSFEQIYGMVDGDSASAAELCSLLSALAEVPIKQSFALTGAIDQYGELQSIGGVNEKIEGFFDICQARGLTGEQGVLIPAINIKNLMLREDVVEAAKAKKFSIYPIENVDQAISLLTGLPAGKRNKSGKFPKNSLNDKVEQRLVKFSEDQIIERLKLKEVVMPRGDKSSYTPKQVRQANHIEQSEKREGKSNKVAERIAWATVNKQTGGGKKKKK